jgi:hypothetical protein
MGYAALGLSIVGFVTGLTAPFKVLLVFILLVFLGSVGFVIANGSSFPRAVLTIVAAQTIIQTSYFIGAATRHALSRNRMRHIL